MNTHTDMSTDTE